MVEATRRPTKAEPEFEGDCFGKLYLKTAPECSVCVVRKHCRRSMNRDNEENDMAGKKKAKKEDKAEKKEEKKEIKVVPVSKKYKKDKENCGMRPGSAGWAVYKVLSEVIDKRAEFTVEELSNKTRVFCKMKEVVKEFGGKIDFNPEAKLPIMLRAFTDWGLVQKTGDDEYKKVI